MLDMITLGSLNYIKRVQTLSILTSEHRKGYHQLTCDVHNTMTLRQDVSHHTKTVLSQHRKKTDSPLLPLSFVALHVWFHLPGEPLILSELGLSIT